MSDEELFLLLQKYRENRLSADEYFHLRTWVDESPEHKLFVENFIKMYKLEAQYEAAHSIDISQAWKVFCNRRQRRKWRVRYWTAAACFLGLVFVMACIYYTTSYKEQESPKLSEILQNHGSRRAIVTLTSGETIEVNDSVMAINDEFLSSMSCSENTTKQKNADIKAEQLNEVKVPRGGEFSLVLPDGTKVWINSESTLSFPSNFSETRYVQLQGEAYFDVVKNGMPFEVQTSNMIVRVLGTQFNISAYCSEPALTTLVQGGVEVRNAYGKVQLSPGQQAEVQSENSSIEIREVNTSMYTAWVTGVFDFDNTSLEEIMTQLSRWYNVEVEFEKPALQHIYFSGTILRKESLGYTLDIIQKVSDVVFVKENGLIRVEESKKGKE